MAGSRFRGALTLAAALAVALGGAPGAAADSLVYVGTDGNVWLADPDGGRQHRVTSDGTASTPYESPSQTDDGIIVAGRGGGSAARLYRMRQNGELLNEPVPTPVLPFEPKVAPDGSLVAYYTIAAVSYPDCPYCLGTYDQTLFSHPDRLTRYESIPMPHCCEQPSWMGSSAVLLTNGSPTAWYSRVDSDRAQQWFADGDATGSPHMEGLRDAELSGAGDRLAAVRGANPETIALYATNGPPPAAPTIRCEISGAPPRAGQDYGDPTWSPDGRSLAWEEQGGIMVASIPSLDPCQGEAPRLVFPGGKDPDWSTAPNTPPPPSKPGGGGGPRPGPGSTPTDDTVAPRVTLRSVEAGLRAGLRWGLRLRVGCSEPSALTARVEIARAAARRLRLGAGRTVVVARGQARLRNAGTATIRLRFNAKARRRLRAVRRLKATVVVRAVDSAGNARQARRAVALVR